MVNGLVMVPSLEVIVEMVEAGQLSSLPVHRSLGVDHGDVVCFHDDRCDRPYRKEAWVYVLVTGVSEWCPYRGRYSDGENALVQFKVLSDLSSFVIE